jgi:hypothetical protein
MMPSALDFSEAAIFSRLIETEHAGLSPELANHILSLRLSAADEQRIDQLLPIAQDGALTPDDQEELENLNHIADLLSLWHSKARRRIKPRTSFR